MALLAALPATFVSPAAAHDHALPRLVLEHDGQKQHGTNHHAWWTSRAGEDTCWTLTASGPRTFPMDAVREPDPWAAIRILKRQAPVEVHLRAWALVDPTGDPIGDPTVVDTDVRRVRGAATRQWGVVFEPPFVGDNYIDLAVEWKDVEGCGGRQGGAWTFHLFAQGV